MPVRRSRLPPRSRITAGGATHDAGCPVSLGTATADRDPSPAAPGPRSRPRACDREEFHPRIIVLLRCSLRFQTVERARAIEQLEVPNGRFRRAKAYARRRAGIAHGNVAPRFVLRSAAKVWNSGAREARRAGSAAARHLMCSHNGAREFWQQHGRRQGREKPSPHVRTRHGRSEAVGPAKFECAGGSDDVAQLRGRFAAAERPEGKRSRRRSARQQQLGTLVAALSKDAPRSESSRCAARASGRSGRCAISPPSRFRRSPADTRSPARATHRRCHTTPMALCRQAGTPCGFRGNGRRGRQQETGDATPVAVHSWVGTAT